MSNTNEQGAAGMRRFPIWSMVAYVVVISIAVDAALLFSVMAHLSWIYATVWALSAAVVSAGVLFSVLEVWNAKEDRR